jgi:hypothetical protein
VLNYLKGRSNWRAHVLAMVVGIIVALAMTFLPEYFTPLNAVIDRLDRHRTRN